MNLETLKEFKMVVPRSALNVARSEMPQIPKSEYQKFFTYLRKEGVEWKHTRIKAKELKPTQSEYNLGKVENRIGKNLHKEKPVLVSNDYYIADGHHRWLAELNTDKSTKVECIMINKNILDLMAIMKRFSGVHFRDVNDKVQASEIIRKTVAEAFNKKLIRIYKT